MERLKLFEFKMDDKIIGKIWLSISGGMITFDGDPKQWKEFISRYKEDYALIELTAPAKEIE